MISLDLTLLLPNELAREAEAAGLLTASAISQLLAKEVRRRRIDKLFNAADRLAAIEPPLSKAEIQAQIQAARKERPAYDHRLFKSAEEVDHYLREERDSWDD